MTPGPASGVDATGAADVPPGCSTRSDGVDGSTGDAGASGTVGSDGWEGSDG
ncbi:hypothetical protein [Streptomyces sp. NPDC003247]|uniref:hypothetical protein n=1 Tax=Streptomyces sp. NPDC003247 TaxID=3364677 RepID=UPI00368474CF